MYLNGKEEKSMWGKGDLRKGRGTRPILRKFMKGWKTWLGKNGTLGGEQGREGTRSLKKD